MKKVLLFIMLCVVSISVNAQTFKNDGKPYEVYCKLAISGDRIRFRCADIKGSAKLTDDSGKKLDFKNELEAMNYLSKRGWTYVDKIVLQVWTVYIFKKIVVNDQEAKEGLHFEED